MRQKYEAGDRVYAPDENNTGTVTRAVGSSVMVHMDGDEYGSLPFFPSEIWHEDES